MSTTPTTAKHLVVGETFHMCGRSGMSPIAHVAVSIEVSGTTRIVTTAAGSFRMRPQTKVWIAR